VVERHHFQPGLMKSGGDLDYTLRSSPNHHAALLAMMKLAESEKTDKPKYTTYSLPCYFNRAIRAAPDDETVRALYAVYLFKKGDRKQALEQLNEAERLSDGTDANVEYNLGLVYFDLKEYGKSLEHAHRAYALGFPLPGLKSKLQRAGKWREASAVVSKEDSVSTSGKETSSPGTTSDKAAQ
jgi:uncharacterized protein (TIGR02996 family)